MTVLNESLAKRQKITDIQRQELYKLYKKMDKVFSDANKRSVEFLRQGNNGEKYANKIRDLEFQLQENWNFPQEQLSHTWWNNFDKCSCPKMDNDERFGLPKIINSTCPFHGNLTE